MFSGVLHNTAAATAAAAETSTVGMFMARLASDD